LGRLTGVKGVDRLLMAMPQVFSQCPKSKLVVVGKGELEGELVRLAETLGISNRVNFNLNMLPEEERIAHYAACDMAVFPSLYEPFGIVALEAMALKKPIVVGARGVSGLKEIVIASGQDQCGYHINPYDPRDIAWGITSALLDESRLKTMGEKARQRVLSEFTVGAGRRQDSDVHTRSSRGKALELERASTPMTYKEVGSLSLPRHCGGCSLRCGHRRTLRQGGARLRWVGCARIPVP